MSVDSVFGRMLVHDKGRVYAEANAQQLTESEFNYAKVMCDVVFGPTGLVNAIGPAWSLVHDPRFLTIEEKFIFDNTYTPWLKDAKVDNRPVVYTNKVFKRDPAYDLAKYATILGEGRHFARVIINAGGDPHRIKDAKDLELWWLIYNQCPNYFYRNTNTDSTDGPEWYPNKEAQTLFNILKEDLLGLVMDYAFLSNCDNWVSLDDGETPVSDKDIIDENGEVTRINRVFAEIEWLDRALDYRASLRTTALKAIKQLEFEERFDSVELTDEEADEFIKVLYRAEYFELYKVIPELSTILNRAATIPYNQRVEEMIARKKNESADFADRLVAGQATKIDLFTTGKLNMDVPTPECEWIPEAVAYAMKLKDEGNESEYEAILDVLSELYGDIPEERIEEIRNTYMEMKTRFTKNNQVKTIRDIVGLT